MNIKEPHSTKDKDRVPVGRKLAVGAGGFPVQNGGLIVQYMAQPIFQIFLGLNPALFGLAMTCLLYTSPSPRDKRQSRMPSSA